MQKIISKDVSFMSRALAVARRGLGRVHPNPLVGAVLVKDGRVIGEGAHLFFGGAHAEVAAIQKAGREARGATLYITLEPCAHFGKTPPCTDLILKSGIKKVVLGASDPNPLVRGKGARALKARGVAVTLGVLQRECEYLNRDYNHWMKTGKPYVVVKAAQSLDGKIATHAGRSKWITGVEARKFSHELRASSDAVLVGINTILKDNPLLNVRHIRSQSQPLKIVLDSKLKTPLTSNIFSKASSAPVILAVASPVSALQEKRFKGRARIIRVVGRAGRVDLAALLKILGKERVLRILIEGGAETLGDAFDKHLVNEAYFFIAPKVIGGKEALSAVGGKGASAPEKAMAFRQMSIEKVGSDFLLHGVL